MHRRSGKKMLESFYVISNLVVITRIAVDYSREDFFLKGISESKQVTKSAKGSKNNIKLTNDIFFSIMCLKHAFKSREDLSV